MPEKGEIDGVEGCNDNMTGAESSGSPEDGRELAIRELFAEIEAWVRIDSQHQCVMVDNMCQ